MLVHPIHIFSLSISLTLHNFIHTETEEVGNVAAFLVSQLASAITGSVVYVNNGLNAMGVGVDSPIFENLELPKEA